MHSPSTAGVVQCCRDCRKADVDDSFVRDGPPVSGEILPVRCSNSLLASLGNLTLNRCSTGASCKGPALNASKIRYFPVKFPVSRECERRLVRIPLRRQPVLAKAVLSLNCNELAPAFSSCPNACPNVALLPVTSDKARRGIAPTNLVKIKGLTRFFGADGGTRFGANVIRIGEITLQKENLKRAPR